MQTRPPITRLALGLLLIVSSAFGMGCTDVPLLNNVRLPVTYFPCAVLGPGRESWATHPFAPVPGTIPPASDAGPIPDSGPRDCDDAGGDFFTPDASPTSCEWMLFDEKTTINLAHPLGRRPQSVEIYLSFSRDGSASTLGTGDSALIMQSCATDVTIRNNTGQRFFARVVIR